MSLNALAARRPSEEEHLLPHSTEWAELTIMGAGDDQPQVEHRYTDEVSNGETSGSGAGVVEEAIAGANGGGAVVYRVYKRRWFGLIQLVLLNIIVSWDWLTFSPVANTAALYFRTTPSTINWLSTSFLFAFLVASPFTVYTLHRSGPRASIIAASVLLLLGNWIRYIGVRLPAQHTQFPVVMLGQILIGLAQPFVLSAPTRYSDLWFTPAGRVSATALASLANPFGGALGQLIDPFLATEPGQIPNMTLYIALISSAVTIPSFFIPARPPTPASPASGTRAPLPLATTTKLLAITPHFYLIFFPFAIYVGLFNSISSLLTQILTPYGLSETESGIAGALLILVGLVSAAITSPIVDRNKRYLLFIKILVPLIGISYLAFIWAPPTRSVAAPYAILSILGAASFSLVPVALEFLVEITYPVGPEVGSVVCWAGGQLFGGVFIVVSDALKASRDADPPFNMTRTLVFQAVLALAVVPAPICLGWIGGKVVGKRAEVDKGVEGERREVG